MKVPHLNYFFCKNFTIYLLGDRQISSKHSVIKRECLLGRDEKDIPEFISTCQIANKLNTSLKPHGPIAINSSTNFNLGRYRNGLYRQSACILWKYNYFGVITFRKLHTLVCYLPFFLHIKRPSFSPTCFANSIDIPRASLPIQIQYF